MMYKIFNLLYSFILINKKNKNKKMNELFINLIKMFIYIL